MTSEIEMTTEQAKELTREFPALAAAVSALHGNARGGFISLTNYTAHSGRIEPETSSYMLNGKISYENTLRRSIEMVEDGTISVADVCNSASADAETVKKAMAEQLKSWHKSLDRIESGEPPDETHYEHFGAGAKRHRETGILHVSGLLVRKTIKTPGTYKPVKSALKTLAKKALVRMTPMGKWRQFRLSVDRYERVAVGGKVIEGKVA